MKRKASCLDDYPHGQKYDHQWAALGSWFLGPKAENADVFNNLAVKAFKGHADFRKNYFPTDTAYITANITVTDAYKDEKKQLDDNLAKMIEELKNSSPNFSERYVGHMLWDTSIPANLGYLAALLYNQNNVANEASPVTTSYEIEVGKQLCEMLGYEFNDKTPDPWGHITSCGSIGNIEAMWACRNIKHYPFCVQKALKEKQELAKAKDFKVYVPRYQKKKKLVDLNNWDLLNLDIDDIVAMPDEVIKKSGISKDEYTNMVDENNLASLGWYDFMKLYGLDKRPVVLAPMSMHYSWSKAAIVLGVGQRNIIGIEFDENARMDIEDLKRKLDQCLESQTPVISVVAVIGTTEESAVDPLADIVNLREVFKKKGLNFAINADAAWGGYFMTMLHKPKSPLRSKIGKEIPTLPPSDYIPKFPLSDYTTKHLRSMRFADTITIDPHKSGFCPYPAGGLCYRNGNMRGFIQVEAAVVYHQGKDPSVGTWGIEGSKPGAAPAGVLLSHRVIGLDQLGYGRILGQCTFGAKLFYCIWLDLANEADNFVCVPMKPLPSNMTMQQAISTFRNHIMNKKFADLQKDPVAMEFLKTVGPDTLINAFAVNLKGNTNLQLCNGINFEVFRRLSHTNENQNVMRIPVILTSSNLHSMKFGRAVKQFKKRLDLPEDTAGDLTFLINTIMNPWVAEPHKIHKIGKIVRQTVLDAIGKMTDEPDHHGFVSPDMITDNGDLFGDHLPMFDMKPHQYHAIAKFNVPDSKAVKIIQQKYKKQMALDPSQRMPIIFSNKAKAGLQNFLEDAMNEALDMNFFVGPPTGKNKPFLTTKVTVLDIPRRKHFDMTLTEYPARLTYFMFGTKENAYLSHNMSIKPDVHQVVKLDRIPDDVPEVLVELGIDITINNLKREPLKIDGKIVDPLQLQEYTISYTSIDGIIAQSTIYMTSDQAKVWFNVVDK